MRLTRFGSLVGNAARQAHQAAFAGVVLVSAAAAAVSCEGAVEGIESVSSLADSSIRRDSAVSDASVKSEPDAQLPIGPIPFAGVYASAKPAVSAKAKHAAKGITILSSNPSTDCTGCHAVGGQAASKAFSFSGVVYKDADGTAPAVDAEVWVMDGAGAKAKANTDENGHVWLLASTTALSPPFVAGVRTAQVQRVMQQNTGTLRSCNTADCHGGPNRIHTD